MEDDYKFASQHFERSINDFAVLLEFAEKLRTFPTNLLYGCLEVAKEKQVSNIENIDALLEKIRKNQSRPLPLLLQPLLSNKTSAAAAASSGSALSQQAVATTTTTTQASAVDSNVVDGDAIDEEEEEEQGYGGISDPSASEQIANAIAKMPKSSGTRTRKDEVERVILESILTIPEDNIYVNVEQVPIFLRSQDTKFSDVEMLEPHLRNAFRHIFRGELVSLKRSSKSQYTKVPLDAQLLAAAEHEAAAKRHSYRHSSAVIQLSPSMFSFPSSTSMTGLSAFALSAPSSGGNSSTGTGSSSDQQQQPQHQQQQQQQEQQQHGKQHGQQEEQEHHVDCAPPTYTTTTTTIAYPEDVHDVGDLNISGISTTTAVIHESEVDLDSESSTNNTTTSNTESESNNNNNANNKVLNSNNNSTNTESELDEISSSGGSYRKDSVFDNTHSDNTGNDGTNTSSDRRMTCDDYQLVSYSEYLRGAVIRSAINAASTANNNISPSNVAAQQQSTAEKRHHKSNSDTPSNLDITPASVLAAAAAATAAASKQRHSNNSNANDEDVMDLFYDEESIKSVTPRVLSVFDPSFKWENLEETVCRRTPVYPYPIDKSFKLLIRIQSAQLDLGRLEPLYGSISLYDARLKAKISENYYFPLNVTTDVLDYIGQQHIPPEVMAFLKVKSNANNLHALFSIENPHSDIYLVLFVEKILQAGKPFKHYHDPSKADKSSIKAKIRDAYANGGKGKFREPLFWGFEKLFDSVETPGASHHHHHHSSSSSSSSRSRGNASTSSSSSSSAPSASGSDRNSRAYSLPTRTNLNTPSNNNNNDNSVSPSALETSRHHLNGSSNKNIVEATLRTTREKVKLREGLITFRKLYEVTGDGSYRLDVGSVLANQDEYIAKKIKTAKGYFLVEAYNPRIDNFNDIPNIVYKIDNVIGLAKQHQNVKNLVFNEHLVRNFHTVNPLKDHNGCNHHPNMCYLNRLYVYPIKADLSGVHLKAIKPRNVVVKVMLRDDDTVGVAELADINATTNNLVSDSNSNKQLVFYSRYQNNVNLAAPLRTKFGLTSGTYHEKNPQFLDEFSLDLPVPFKPKYHLVFVFYHVHCAEGKDTTTSYGNSNFNGDSEDPVEIIGYSVLRLIENSIIVPDGAHNLPIYKSLTNGYLSSISNNSSLTSSSNSGSGNNNRGPGSLEAFNNRKDLFQVTTKFSSTIYSQDQHLAKFFKDTAPFLSTKRDSSHSPTSSPHSSGVGHSLASTKKSVQQLIFFNLGTASIQNLRSLSRWDLHLPNLPVILNMLLEMLVRIQENFSRSETLPALGGGGGGALEPLLLLKSKQRSNSANTVGRTTSSISEAPRRTASIELRRDSGEYSSSVSTGGDIANPGSLQSKLFAPILHATQKKMVQLQITTTTNNNDNELEVELSSSSSSTSTGSSSPQRPASPSKLHSQATGSQMSKLGALLQNHHDIGSNSGEELAQHIREATKATFTSLLFLLKTSSDILRARGRSNTLLATYVQYIFDNPPDVLNPNLINNSVGASAPPSIFVALCEEWNAYLTAEENQDWTTKDGLTSDNDTDQALAAVQESFHNQHSDVSGLGSKPTVGIFTKGTLRLRKSIVGRSTFRGRTTASTENPTSYGEDYGGGSSGRDKFSAKDTLAYAWFFFDVMAKSFILSAKGHERRRTKATSATGSAVASDSDFPSSTDACAPTISVFEAAVMAAAAAEEEEHRHCGAVARMKAAQEQLFVRALKDLQHTIIQIIINRLITSNSEDDHELAADLNVQIALFYRDLMHVMKPMYLQQLLNEYLLEISMKVTSQSLRLKLDFVQVISDHEHFLELNLNSHFELYFINHVIEVVCEALKSSQDATLRMSAIDVFRRLLTKHDFDSRYQDETVRKAIALAYFPVVQLWADVDEFLSSGSKGQASVLDDEQRANCLVCVAHILKNMDRERLMGWWRGESVQSQINFINLLTTILLTFNKYKSKIARTTVKMVCLDIYRQFIDDMKDKIIAEIARKEAKAAAMANLIGDNEEGAEPDLMAVCTQFLTRYLERSGAESGKERRSGQSGPSAADKNLTYSIFMPTLRRFVVTFHEQLTKDPRNRNWKWIVGALLVHCDVPTMTSKTQHPSVLEILAMLLEPHETTFYEDFVPSPLVIEPDAEDNIQLSDTDKNVIRCAALDKLIERATYADNQDPKFLMVFFLTYRSFTTPFELLDKLIQRFRMSIADGIDPKHDPIPTITLRCLNAIKHWLQEHFYDFDNVLITRLIKFLDIEVGTAYPKSAVQVKKLLEKKLLEQKANAAIIFGDNSHAPPSRLPKSFNPYAEFNLLEWPSIEIARQITLIEYDIFKSIRPKECLKQAWTKKNKLALAPNIVALTDRWNSSTSWVATTIVREPDVKMRARIVVKFIEIAQHLRELNNYNGVTALVAGLSNTAVNRMKRTWELVPEASIEEFKRLEALVDPQGASKNMRAELVKCVPPCVPPFSMYAKDLTFIEDGNPDFIKDLINFTKRQHISKVILEVKTFQQTPYHLKVVPYLRDVLTSGIFQNLMTEDQLWKESLRVEPKAKPGGNMNAAAVAAASAAVANHPQNR